MFFRRTLKMITNITIDNFRQFDHLEVKDLKRINFLVGKNNCGKTTVLEALFIMVGPQIYEAWAKLSRFRGLALQNDLMLNAFGNSPTNTIKLSININEEHCKLIISPKTENEMPFTSLLGESNQVKKAYDYNITTTKDDAEEVYEASVLVLQNGDHLTPIKTFLNAYGGCVFLSEKTLMIDMKWQIQELFKKSQEHKLVELLKLFSDTITNIFVVGDDIYIDQENVETEKIVRLPLALMGDGLKKYLTIVCALLDERLNCIFIDEIENGLHFETQKTLLRAILRLSKEKSLQMFITTHSYETLKFLSEIMQEDEFNTQKEEVQVINVANTIKKGYQSYNYSIDGLIDFIHNETEVRD